MTSKPLARGAHRRALLTMRLYQVRRYGDCEYQQFEDARANLMRESLARDWSIRRVTTKHGKRLVVVTRLV